MGFQGDGKWGSGAMANGFQGDGKWGSRAMANGVPGRWQMGFQGDGKWGSRAMASIAPTLIHRPGLHLLLNFFPRQDGDLCEYDILIPSLH